MAKLRHRGRRQPVADSLRRTFGFVMQHARQEPIAVLLLVAALASAQFAREQVQVNLPKVEFNRLTGFGGEVIFLGVKPENGRVSAERLHVVNTGGRAATLTVLDSAPSPALLEAILEDGRPKLRVTEAYVVEVGLLKDDVPHELAAMLEAARSVKFERLEFPYVLGEPIESGKARVLALIFRLRGKDGRLVVDAPVAFTCKAKFSDGSAFDVFASFSGGP